MTTRAEEIAADGPYRVEKSSGVYVIMGPQGRWPFHFSHESTAKVRADDFNKVYKQGQQDRWIPLEAVLKSRGLHWLPEGSLVAWRRKQKPHHSYEHGIYRENEDKARDQFSLKGCDVIILELPQHLNR